GGAPGTNSADSAILRSGSGGGLLVHGSNANVSADFRLNTPHENKMEDAGGVFGCGSFESSNHDFNGTRAKGKNHGPGSNTANGLEQLGRLRGKSERERYPRAFIMDVAKVNIARRGIR